ncbi:MAG TPA: hypothetical protein VM688_07495, partial [Nocardioidaceae bacterium]|nr:hypothetical protein [Nocardioidaceae bacterium]
RRTASRDVVRHGDHVHVGASSLGTHDLDEARSILDEADGTNQDLHQLAGQGVLPTRLPRTMVAATGVLVVLSLGITVVAGPLFGFTQRAARDVLDRTLYISSVLPEGSR